MSDTKRLSSHGRLIFSKICTDLGSASVSAAGCSGFQQQQELNAPWLVGDHVAELIPGLLSLQHGGSLHGQMMEVEKRVHLEVG